MRSIVVAAMALALVACSDDVTNPATSFTADLTGAKVRPAPSGNTATGTATCTIDNANEEVSCTLNWTDLGAAATEAYIGSGNASSAGTEGVVYLCGGGAAPACPGATASSFASGAQGVSSGTYSTLVGQMRTYGAFVQVETAAGPQIRGQIFGVY